MTHPILKPMPGILEIAPYQGGAAHADGVAKVYKLSSNENPLGPSQDAIRAAREAAGALELYPDGGHLALREAIAEIHGIEPHRVACGSGSDEIIALLCKCYAGPGDEVLHSAHGFLMYKIYSLGAGATPVSARETDLTTDIDLMIGAMNERTRLVFIANPNSPTGTMVGLDEIVRLADALPPRAMLVLDGAYAEYVSDYDGGIELVRARDNVVMTRTFSKVYGLGALRLGWCYAPDHVIDVLNRVRGPFNVTAPALAAGEAAVRDQDWVAHCVAENAVWRDWVTAELTRLNIPVTPSHGNFVLAEIGERVAACDQHLKSRGVLVRRMDGYGLPRHLRISIGDEAGCRALIDGIRDWIVA